MKEIYVFRINNAYADLLPKTIKKKNIGPVTMITIQGNSPEYQMIKDIAEKIKSYNSEKFFYGWGIKRKYTKVELANALLFKLNIGNTFEPTGEECGTIYDETTACSICGANRSQIGPLMIKPGTVPKKDIAETIAGEIVVSEKFVAASIRSNLKGLGFTPVNIKKYFQLRANEEVELSPKTIAGVNPFDLSTGDQEEIYCCPDGHTIGLNLLSEAYVLNSPTVSENDFLVSKQKIGVKRGLLRPEPIYFCSQAFRRMVEKERLSGFEFEVANIE